MQSNSDDSVIVLLVLYAVGKNWRDIVRVPIIDNGDLETDFTEDLGEAIQKYPDVDCVLVR